MSSATALPTGFGGLVIGSLASCTAEFVTVPVDLVKTRLQLTKSFTAVRPHSRSWQATLHVIRHEGWHSLWKGASPALARQATYGGLRLSLYEPLKAFLCDISQCNQESLFLKIASGCAAGATASFICNPTDVIKVRMMADTSTASSSRRYKSIWTALGAIWETEGVAGLYRGVWATTMRAALVAGSELSVYDHAKHVLCSVGFGWDDAKTHFLASMLAGFVATIVSSPADLVKSRMMNESMNSADAYKSVWDCIKRTIDREGTRALWKGFWPNYMRLGPHSVVLFLTMEQLKLVWAKLY